jgi:hypothetical protein
MVAVVAVVLVAVMAMVMTMVDVPRKGGVVKTAV